MVRSTAKALLTESTLERELREIESPDVILKDGQMDENDDRLIQPDEINVGEMMEWE